MRVYLDDERKMPEFFDTLARTAEEAIELLKTGKVEVISLDHDLGTDLTGYDVAKFIEESVVKGELKMPRCMVHTQNPVGRKNICAAIQSAKRHSMKEE